MKTVTHVDVEGVRTVKNRCKIGEKPVKILKCREGGECSRVKEWIGRCQNDEIEAARKKIPSKSFKNCKYTEGQGLSVLQNPSKRLSKTFKIIKTVMGKVAGKGWQGLF